MKISTKNKQNLTTIYSINFGLPKRSKKLIKFIIIHYTGMRNETAAIKKLCSKNSQVSAHYFIKNTGKILNLVPDLYEAWHAGKSSWKNYKSLNQNSIGIEITNPGHEFGYKAFPKKQIFSLLKLSKFLMKEYKISPKNILGHSDIAPQRKKDPGEKFPWEYFSKNRIGIWHSLSKRELIKNRKLKTSIIEKEFFFNSLSKIGYLKKTQRKRNKEKYLRDVTKAFQRRYRQELVNGRIDQECLLICKNILKKHN